MTLDHVEMNYKSDQNLHKLVCHFVDGNLEFEYMMSHHVQQLITMIIEDFSASEVVEKLDEVRNNSMEKRLFLSMMTKKSYESEDKALYGKLSEIFMTFFNFMREFHAKKRLLLTVKGKHTDEQLEQFYGLFKTIIATVEDAFGNPESYSTQGLLDFYGEEGEEYYRLALDTVLGKCNSSPTLGALPSQEELLKIISEMRYATAIAVDPDQSLLADSLATAVVGREVLGERLGK